MAGLILAGSADFKTVLSESDHFDPRLQAVVLGVVDVSYGGENGFNQAIELSSDILSNVKFVQEKRLIGKFFEEISQDTSKYVFGVNDTLACLDMGAVETLLVWESLDCDRFELLNTTSGKIEVKHLTAEQQKDTSHFKVSPLIILDPISTDTLLLVFEGQGDQHGSGGAREKGLVGMAGGQLQEVWMRPRVHH